MRFYVKLVLLIATFLGAAWASNPAQQDWPWEVSFAARCYIAHLLEDQQLEDQLMAEARVELRRRRELAMADLFESENLPAARESLPDALAVACVPAK